jgi:hypothetical protein
MIKTITLIVCDCCNSRLEFSTLDDTLAMHEARRHGWYVKYRPAHHYCPDCKVPAKLAKELEAAK